MRRLSSRYGWIRRVVASAGTSGEVGPNLDEVDLDAAEVEAIVREGRGAMPTFEGELTDDEITAVASFVAD